MRTMLRNSVRTVGLAAAITGAPFALAAEDGLSVSWKGGTTFKGGENKVKLRMRCELTALAFYHDQDDEYNRDQIYRTFSLPPTDQDGDGDVDVNDYAAIFSAYDAIWYGVEHDFADGIKLKDAELYFKGKAWDRIIFALRLDAKKDVTYLDKWYMGITGIPGVGSVRLGEFDVAAFLSDTEYLFGKDKGVAMEAFCSPDLVGVFANNDFLDERLWYEFGVGMQSGEPGTTDHNYDVQFGIGGTPVKTDQVQLDLGLSVLHMNPSPSNHAGYSESMGYEVAIMGGPDVIGFEAATEDALAVNGSVGVAVGRLWAGANYSIVQGNAPTEPDLESLALTNLIVSGGASTTINEYNDWDASGGGICVAVSLTGEAEKMGGGIGSPNANLAFDGSGFGAFEAVGRYQMIDIEDNAHDQVTLLNPLSGITSTTIVNTILQQNSNRMEGGEADQFTIGVNWYPTPKCHFGLFVNQQNWEYDSGAYSISDDLVMATQPVLSLSSLAELWEYNTITSIVNDYSCTSVVFSGRYVF